jgi:DNA-binding NtrC family response regulator
MRRVLEVLEPLARADVTVTLTGETGTGKDVLARRIHQQSERASGPFVVFDCGAVAANLAESELLGHERGAFTGALATHEGAFERANGGTLFLDEIGELPLDLQTRLLRVLGNGRFRQDLYFRLAAAVVAVPPLRERLEDLPALVGLLLDDLGYGAVEVTREALAVLARRPWPGNVRELKNTLSCAVAFLDSQLLEPRHLTFAAPPEAQCTSIEPPLGGLKLERVEREAIEQTLRMTGGNKARAAELLGIAPSTLYEKLKKYQRTPKQ